MKLFNYLEKHITILLFCLFVISFVIRVGWVYMDYSHNSVKEWSDAIYYMEIGERFAAGDFYPPLGPDGYIVDGPVIPFLVAGAELLTGEPVWALLILNCSWERYSSMSYKPGARLISNRRFCPVALERIQFQFNPILLPDPKGTTGHLASAADNPLPDQCGGQEKTYPEPDLIVPGFLFADPHRREVFRLCPTVPADDTCLFRP